MTVIATAVDTRAEAFRRNDTAMRELVAELRDKVAEIKQGGGAAVRERHLKRGKMLPRDRVDALIDVGTPFLELSQLAAYGMYQDNIAGSGIINGIGRVAGRE